MASALETILTSLDAVLAEWPSAVSLAFERAKALAALNRDQEAQEAYLAVIRLDPRHFRALNDLGLLYHRRGLTKEAAECFRAAVETDPQNATGAANWAYMLLARGELAAAKAEFERALALRPEHVVANRGLDDVYRRLGLPARPAPPPAPAAPESPPAAAPCPPEDPVVEYIYDVAANAILVGDNDAVADLLQRLLCRDPAAVPLLWRLADFAFTQRNYTAALRTFEHALAIDPHNLELHIGLATTYEELGDLERANAEWSGDLLRGAIRVFPYTGSGAPVQVLTIASALHAIRYDLLLDPATMQNRTLYTQAYAPDRPLPPHDVVLVAVADVESDARALEIARSIVARTAVPILNHPDRVLRTSRAEQSERLAALEDVVTARVVSVARDALLAPDAAARVGTLGFEFPLLLRSPGFHNGQFFELVEHARDLPSVAATLPTGEVLLISYQDTRSPDGMIRKYRMMTIDGVLYPVHLAVSAHWKIHYVSSAMRDTAEFRIEEAMFLGDPEAALGPRVMRALARVSALMNLDYGGIDFGIDPHGRLAVFEANGAMGIFTPDGDKRWDYRRPAIARALGAARRMIAERASAVGTQLEERAL